MNKQRLFDIVKTAWQAYSGIPLQLSSETLSKNLASQLTLSICASTAPEQHSLLLCISRTTAVDLAASMFALPADETTEANIEDAVSEIVNIIAGRVEKEFDRVGRLGIPTAVSSEKFQKCYTKLPIELDLLLIANATPLYIAFVAEDPITLLGGPMQ